MRQTSDQCYQGTCGTWVTIPTVIESEAERLAWVAADPNIENSQCFECSNQYPMYLSLQGGIQNCPAGATTVADGCLGHGAGVVWAGVYSYMQWRHPDLHFTAWRRTAGDNVGDMRGRALFVSKSGECAGVGQWGDDGRGGHGQSQSGGEAQLCRAGTTANQLSVRSEAQFEVDGFSQMEVFVPANEVSIMNVATHSTRSYEAAPITIGQPFYTDRMYALTALPDFLTGLMGIKTACDDKHSDPTDLEFLCFDINDRAAVYVLVK